MTMFYCLGYSQRACMIGCALLNLQRAVMDWVMFIQSLYDIIHEGIAGMTARHDKMYRQRSFGGAQAPNMQIMYISYTAQLA